MKSEKGITLTSLVILIELVLLLQPHINNNVLKHTKTIFLFI